MNPMNPENLEAFTGRADAYATARPSYADAAVDYILGLLPPNAVIADVGAGTGKFAELIARRGNRLFAVEPNPDMRGKLADTLSAYGNASVVGGTAENTTLADGSVHAVICAQAFHWFDAGAFGRECSRVLMPGGRVFIVYNIDLSHKDAAHDDLHQQDHDKRKREYDEARRAFFGGYISCAEFPNDARYTREQFQAFMLSHSHSPRAGAPEYAEWRGKADAVFDRENVGGVLTKRFVTCVYTSSLGIGGNRE